MVPDVFARYQVTPAEVKLRGLERTLSELLTAVMPEIREVFRDASRPVQVNVTFSVEIFKAPRAPLKDAMG